MKLTHGRRKILAVLTVCIGLPVYVIIAVNLINRFDRLPTLLELALYVILGIGWIFPLRRVFMGIGKPDPDASE